MSFQERFKFPAPLPNRPADGPDLTLNGHDTASGRAITLHLLSAAALDNNRILEQIQTLPPLERVHILETGTWNGAPFIVTDPLPGGQTLRRWLRSLADDELDKLARAGKFRISLSGLSSDPRELGNPANVQPAATPSPADLPTQLLAVSPIALPADAPTELLPVAEPPSPPPAVPPPPSPAVEPGEFTRMFQGKLPGRAAEPPPPPPPSAVPPPPSPTAEPGELTRMFQGNPAVSTPVAAPSFASEPASPSEFTRMFQGRTSAVPPPQITSPAPPASAPEAGDSSPLFQRPSALSEGPTAPSAPLPPPSSQPGPANPSEFTQMLQGFAMPTSPQPYVPPAPVPGHPPSKGEVGEFTRMVQSPLPNLKPVNPATQPPPGRDFEPGEFTRMLEAQVDSPIRSAAKPRLQAGGDATRAFSFDEISQPAPAASDQPVESGPSEYTLLFKQPKAAPPPQEAPKPAPAPVAPRKKKSATWLLVVILVSVLALIGGIAVSLIWSW